MSELNITPDRPIKGINVLLLEDDPMDAELITREIQKVAKGSEVTIINDFEAFAKDVNSKVYDLIISDYNLNSFTGLDVLRFLQEQKRTIPFIFVTGTLEDEELAANTILAGANGFILKKNLPKLHLKLKPFFEDIISPTSTLRRIQQFKREIAGYKEFVDRIQKDVEEMKDDISKIRDSI